MLFVKYHIFMRNNRKNLIGQTIGHLKVISAKDEDFFNCKCECGNKTIVRADKLINRKIKSCGCLSKKKKKSINEISEQFDKQAAIKIENHKSFTVPKELKFMPSKELIGLKFGKLTILDAVVSTWNPTNSRKRRMELLCLCECGNQRTFRRWSVVSGKTKSCGHIRDAADLPIDRNAAGLSAKYHRTYIAWLEMLQESPKLICDNWLNFETFLRDMGEHPAGKSHIFRLDKSQKFEPGNCIWLGDQANIEFKIDNVKIIISPDKAWAKFFKISGAKYLK